MFPDLDKSSAFIARRSFNEGSLDICDPDLLTYASLYEDFSEKKDKAGKLGYIAPARLPIGKDGIVNIRPLLLLDGLKFINTAYMTILGRVPERPAVNALMSSLSADSSREAKLRHLQKIGSSQEAKLRNAVLTGYDSIDIKELYRYSDREFIEKAYISILFRKPDTEGGKHFLSYLRSPEYSAAEILHMLRHSSEGEKNGVNVIGLDEEYNKRMKRKKLMKIPVLGRVGRSAYNLFTANRRINALEKENYQLRDILGSGRADIEGSLNRLEQQTMKASAAAGKTEAIAGRIGAAEHRINELNSRYNSSEQRLNKLDDQYNSSEQRLNKFDSRFDSAEGRIEELANLNKAAESRLDEMTICSDNIGRAFNELDGFVHQIGDNVNSLNKGHNEHGGHLNELSVSVTKLAEDAQKRTESFEKSYRELDGFVHQIGDNVADLNKAMANHDEILSGYAGEDKKTVQMLLSEVFSLKSRINALERNSASAVKTSDEAAVDVPSSAASSNVYSSIDYFDFENHFRGSREHVKSVQRIYLPYFEGRKNVLDLGCGRGEFTELLTENNIGVTGVDMYEPYVEYMKTLGLPAVFDDAVAYLRRKESTDGIFMGQVVEHISVDQIAEICRLAYEKLEKGSCLIMETPNPRSLAIFYSAFYIDPSHNKPVHPLTLKYIAEKSGFSKVEILYTEGSKPPFSIPKLKEGEPDFEAFNEAMQRVSELLYGSQDYAVIARK